MKKLAFSQFIILLIGTVFAWTNFMFELFAWLNDKPCETGCSASNEVVNPFFTPCFYGAAFFLLAFIVSITMLIVVKRKEKKDVQSKENNENKETLE